MEQVRKKYWKTEIGEIPIDWKIKPLGELCEKVMVGIASAATHAYCDKGVIMFRNQNIKVNSLNDKDVLYIKEEYEVLFKNKRLKHGDILTARTGYPGTSCVVPKQYEGTQSFTTLITRPKSEWLLSQFLCNYINSSKGVSFFDKNQIGGGQKNVNASTLKLMPIPVPTLAEQKAIADALSDVDELIANLEKLIAKKKAIKKGAMQQLLTPPNKGGKRLEGFSGEWKEVTLGELCRISKGQLITENSRVSGEIPVIAGGKTPAYYHNKANRFGKTITVSASGASAGYVSFHTKPIFASDCSTIEEGNYYVIEFIFFFLQSIQSRIYKMQTGGAQPHIHPSDLNPISLYVPSISEQSTIANILSEMEVEIQSLEKRLSKANQLKQGMMQELLTGKTQII